MPKKRKSNKKIKAQQKKRGTKRGTSSGFQKGKKSTVPKPKKITFLK
jgi:hypothetical protein